MDTLYYGYEPQTLDQDLAALFIWESTDSLCAPIGNSPSGRPVWGHRAANPVFGTAAGLGRWVIPGWGSDASDNFLGYYNINVFGSGIFTPCYSDDRYNWQPGRVQGDPSIKITGWTYCVSGAYGGQNIYNQKFVVVPDDYNGYGFWSYDGVDWFRNLIRHPHHYPEYKGFWAKATGDYYGLRDVSIMSQDERIALDMYNSAMGWAYVNWCRDRFLALPMNNKGAVCDITSTVYLDPIDEIITSFDGVNWITNNHGLPRHGNWQTPVYALGRYVVPGHDSQWEFRGNLSDEWVLRLDRGIHYETGPGEVGPSYSYRRRLGKSFLAFSVDGTNFPSSSVVEFLGWPDGLMLAEGGGKLVILPHGSSGVVYVMTSPTQSPVGVAMPTPDGVWTGLIYGHDRFIAFDTHSRKTAISEDGLTWTNGELLPHSFSSEDYEDRPPAGMTDRRAGYAPKTGGSGHFMVTHNDARMIGRGTYVPPEIAYGHWPWE